MTALEFPDAAAETGLDMVADAAESSLLNPGSDGLVQGSNAEILDRLASYQDEGHSMARLRRDFAIRPDIGNGVIENAADYARMLRQQRDGTKPVMRSRVYSGYELPGRAERLKMYAERDRREREARSAS